MSQSAIAIPSTAIRCPPPVIARDFVHHPPAPQAQPRKLSRQELDVLRESGPPRILKTCPTSTGPIIVSVTHDTTRRPGFNSGMSLRSALAAVWTGISEGAGRRKTKEGYQVDRLPTVLEEMPENEG
ncbi:hypothetical protein IAR50_001868 [Cryptococcus sp. DSM 104548]